MIEHTRDGSVHILTMRNEQNLLDPPFVARLNEALGEAEAVSEDAALVLTGEGKYFSNGLNLAELSKLGASGMQDFWQETTRLMGRLLASPMPTVAALNGHTFAGGAMIALACDYRLMREDKGWFCLPEVDIGMPVPPPVMELVQAKLPRATARDAVLTGKRYTADEAIAAGIVDGKASEDALLSTATELAGSLAGRNRNAFNAMKSTLWGDVARGLGAEPG